MDLKGYESPFSLRWINVDNAEWAKTEDVTGGQIVDLNATNEKGSLAILIKGLKA